jgi:hypothetical protein
MHGGLVADLGGPTMFAWIASKTAPAQLSTEAALEVVPTEIGTESKPVRQ